MHYTRHQTAVFWLHPACYQGCLLMFFLQCMYIHTHLLYNICAIIYVRTCSAVRSLWACANISYPPLNFLTCADKWMGQNKEQLHIRTFPNRHTHTITHPNISQQAYTHNYTSEHPPTGIHTNLHIRTSPNRHSYTHNYTSEHPPTGIHTQLHIRTFRAPRCVHWMSTSALSEVLPRIRDRSNAILGKRTRIVCSVSSL